MRIREYSAPPSKVFKLSTPMHLLAKLHWEIAGYKRALKSKSLLSPLLPAYHAFNCAITAWHITDWIWEYVQTEGHARLAKTYSLPKITLREFQNAVSRDSRAINACQEIANGSKHREVKRPKADPHVRATEMWAEIAPNKYGTVWLITDRTGSRPALEVFAEAADYWQRALAPWMEDRFVMATKRRRERLSY